MSAGKAFIECSETRIGLMEGLNEKIVAMFPKDLYEDFQDVALKELGNDKFIAPFENDHAYEVR